MPVDAVNELLNNVDEIIANGEQLDKTLRQEAADAKENAQAACTSALNRWQGNSTQYDTASKQSKRYPVTPKKTGLAAFEGIVRRNTKRLPTAIAGTKTDALNRYKAARAEKNQQLKPGCSNNKSSNNKKQSNAIGNAIKTAINRKSTVAKTGEKEDKATKLAPKNVTRKRLRFEKSSSGETTGNDEADTVPDEVDDEPYMGESIDSEAV